MKEVFSSNYFILFVNFATSLLLTFRAGAPSLTRTNIFTRKVKICLKGLQNENKFHHHLFCFYIDHF
jgi:hypothetical protein